MKPRLLINLPRDFVDHPALQDIWARAHRMAEVQFLTQDSGEAFAAEITGADAVVSWLGPEYTGPMLDEAKRLGFCGHLDLTQRGLRLALAKGLAVSVASGAFAPAVSEFALTLILSTLRHVSDHQAQMREGREVWVKDLLTGLDRSERELSGRSVGLIGFGPVGQGLAALLKPFHVTLRVYDPEAPVEVLENYGALRAGLATILLESEIVVLCSNVGKSADTLIGAEEIAMLRDRAVVVNVGGAGLLSLDALTERLAEGNLFAALDVFEVEPLPVDSPLRNLPNLYLTPHRAGGTIGSARRAFEWLLDDFEAHLAGRPRHHALTASMLDASEV